MDIFKYADNIIERLEKSRNQIYDLIDSKKINEKDMAILDKFPLQAISLKNLRVACIMDRFTYESYAPECDATR